MGVTSLGIGRQPARTSFMVPLHGLPSWFLHLTLILCAFIELPRRVAIGPLSGLAVMTICITIVAWVLWSACFTTSYRAWMTMLPFVLFLIWVVLVGILRGVTFAGVQNLVVLSGFLALVLLSAHLSQRIPRFSNSVFTTVQRVAVITVLLTIVSLIGKNLHIDSFGLVSGRVAALYLFIPAAFFLGNWRYSGSRWALWVAIGLGILAVLTLSRMASAVIFCLFVAAQWKPGRRGQWLRVLLWGGIVVAAAFFLVKYYEPFRERMFGQDAVFNVGGVPVNAMGRLTFWTRTIESWQESPWLGKGPGSWSRETGILTIDHPHNDYLRVLHDYGAVGLMLFLWSLLTIFLRLWTAWVRSSKLRRPEAQFYFAGLLTLGGFSIAMLTDNPLVYMFLMAPLGVILGTALGISQGSRYIRSRSTAKAITV